MDSIYPVNREQRLPYVSQIRKSSGSKKVGSFHFYHVDPIKLRNLCRFFVRLDQISIRTKAWIIQVLRKIDESAQLYEEIFADDVIGSFVWRQIQIWAQAQQVDAIFLETFLENEGKTAWSSAWGRFYSGCYNELFTKLCSLGLGGYFDIERKKWVNGFEIWV